MVRDGQGRYGREKRQAREGGDHLLREEGGRSPREGGCRSSREGGDHSSREGGGCLSKEGGGRSLRGGGRSSMWWKERTMNFHVGKFKIQHDPMMSEFERT